MEFWLIQYLYQKSLIPNTLDRQKIQQCVFITTECFNWGKLTAMQPSKLVFHNYNLVFLCLIIFVLVPSLANSDTSNYIKNIRVVQEEALRVYIDYSESDNTERYLRSVIPLFNSQVSINTLPLGRASMS